PEPQPYGLFAYLTALNLVVVGIAVRRGWRAVNLLGFVFTVGSVVAWLESGFWPRFPEATLVFGTVCFGLYLVVAAFFSLRSGRPDRRVDMLLIAANPTAYFGFLYVVLDHPQFLLWDDWAGFLAAALALVYFALGYGIWRGVKAGLLPARLYLGVATALLTLAVPLQLSDQAVTLCWTVLALVLWYAGLVIRDGRVRLAAGLIGLLTLVHLMVVDTPVAVWAADVYRPLLNGRTLAFLAVAGGLLVAVRVYRRLSPEPAAGMPSRERRLVNRLPVLAGLLGLLLFTLEANTYCDFQIAQVSKEMAEATQSYQQSPAMFKVDIPPEAYAPWRQQIDYWRNAGRLAVSGIWTLAACLLIASGLWFRRHRWRLAGMGLLGVVLLKVFFLDLAQLDLVFRIVTFMGLGAVMLAASYFYDRFAGSAGKRKGPQEDG
ncbi:MAG: DUF2339 domain-containing protein, partial [Heliobacteriaceae bacterium]|nr:DUF2339 domain-containing protein [Heliobacteriaceae bacterium]